jgi:Tol biopolymer transport system component/DNA-binding winged helix-turn-helix (wHTH) protein
MAEAVTISRVVRFGVFEVDLDKGEVRKSGLKLRLRGQPFRVLSILLEHPGEVVTREEFQQRLWTNDETFVDFEHGLNAVVNRLREVLGDSPENPRFIETVPRCGYRWMQPVEGMGGRSIPAAPRHRWRWLPLAVALLLGIGLSVGVLRFSRSSPKSLAPALTSVPLTALPGYENDPSFSPDGSQVAFTRSEESESKSHIYVKLIGTSGPPLQLTNGPDSDFNPVWSPDGRYIAFFRDLPAGFAILLIPALGGPERKIAETRLVGVPGPYLAWSPDGNFLVTSHKDSSKESTALFVVAIDTGEMRRLTSPPSPVSHSSGDSNPAFSPDGRTLAFIRISDLRTELYLLPVSDALHPMGEAKRIPLGQIRYDPAWTEDGHEIVFSSPQGLWRMGISGSATRSAEPARLPFGDNASCPAISRRGHRLVYSNGIFHNVGIWRMEVLGGPSARDGTRVGSFNRSFIFSTQNDSAPQFSPDGKRIAFMSDRSGAFEIWVCNSDGSSPLQLTFFHGPVVTTPRWSPDGRRIAFDSDAEGGEFDIWVIGAEGGKPVRMSTHPANDGNPSWSRDGGWIYFDSRRTGEQQVWKIPATGGDAIQVTRDGGWAPLESPDGKFLYYTKDLSATTLWRVPLGGGQAAKVLEGLSTYLNLAIADKGIYFVPQNAAPGSSIQFLDLQTNQIRRIASFEKPVGVGVGDYYGGLAISPDGRWILYTRADQGGAELRLVENFR